MGTTKSSNAWYESLLARGLVIEILSPDGWDKNNLSKSFLEKIDFNEFQQRLLSSTIYTNDTKKLIKVLKEFIILN